MGIVTYDGLNGASAQSCKDTCLSRQRIMDQIVAGTYIYICCFTYISMLKSVNQFPSGKSKSTAPSFGKECKRQCREDAAVKLQPRYP